MILILFCTVSLIAQLKTNNKQQITNKKGYSIAFFLRFGESSRFIHGSRLAVRCMETAGYLGTAPTSDQPHAEALNSGLRGPLCRYPRGHPPPRCHLRVLI